MIIDNPLKDAMADPSMATLSATTSPESVLIRMNLQALMLFSEGREEDALAMLRTCVSLGRRVLQRPARNHPTRSPRMAVTTLSTDNIVWPLEDDDSLDGSGNAANSALDGVVPEEHSFSFYPHLFLLEEDEGQRTSSLVLSMQHMCSILSYNHAVLQHQMGVVRANHRLDRSFVRARSSYRASLQHWELSSGLQTVSDNETDRLSLARLWLAIYNNLGHLAALFGDDPEFQFCREGLESTLVTISPPRPRPPVPRGGSPPAAADPVEHALVAGDEDWRLFHSSLTRARNHQPRNAPAA